MRLKTFQGGIHPEENKELSLGSPILTVEPGKELVFPLNAHIGKPAKAVVAKNALVQAGQVIAEADGFVSANVISSVSGKVKAIEERYTVSGKRAMSIVIENDGQYTLAEGIGERKEASTFSNQDILDAVKWAGIIGLGGAGFPTHVKLMPKNPEDIDYVIANGAECEPYLTCDDRLMQEQSRGILDGLKLLLQLFPNAKGVIAIEDNKPEAIRAMEAVCAGEKGVEVQPLMTKYPQGGERNLISAVAGRDLRFGQLPAELGCIVCNVATIYAIYRAVYYTEPLMERYMTISGDAAESPRTVRVRLGTYIQEILDQAGGLKEGVELKKVLVGGPMMGVALPFLNVPTGRGNNGLTLLSTDEVEASMEQMTACIRCGRCARVCPIHLLPQPMAECVRTGNYDEYENRYYGLDCVACGSCTWVCPAKRPLMQLFKKAKAEILASKRK